MLYSCPGCGRILFDLPKLYIEHRGKEYEQAVAAILENNDFYILCCRDTLQTCLSFLQTPSSPNFNYLMNVKNLKIGDDSIAQHIS